MYNIENRIIIPKTPPLGLKHVSNIETVDRNIVEYYEFIEPYF